MEEYEEKEFIEWARVKAAVHARKARFCRVGDIWWVSMGLNIGHEQNGRGDAYERPMIIICTFPNRTCLAVPTTKQTPNGSALNFSVECIIGNQINFVLLSQTRSVATQRLNRKIGHIDQTHLNRIRLALIRIIGI